VKNDVFDKAVEKALKRSTELLERKGEQYTTTDSDRLGQFKQAAEMKGRIPIDALSGMVLKHFSSFIEMSHHPHDFAPEQWREVLDDIRNYTLLAEGVLMDSGVL